MISSELNQDLRRFHPLLRVGAQVISYVFHPLFIPVYISWFLIYNNPLFFGLDNVGKGFLLIRFVMMYTVFPLVTVLLCKGLGFIQSIQLHTQRDRIIPYVACGVYYFWMWYVLKNQPENPRALVLLALAIFLASSAGLILNSYLKISMHAISVGVAVTFISLLAFQSGMNYGLYLSIALFIAGLVCTARLIVSNHSYTEIYMGLAVGMVMQIISNYFV